MTLSGASSNNSVEAARLAANQQTAQQQRSSQLLGLGGSLLGNYLAGSRQINTHLDSGT